jgi:phosphate transport system substrate-binding protein
MVFTLALQATARAETIRYIGSSTVGRFIMDASQIYTESTFEVHIKSESLGGERCVMVSTCDIGGVARAISREALSAGVVGTLIGRDALAVIVNAENPIRELSSKQLKAIFTGEITNWSAFGGPYMQITPHIVLWNSATQKVFKDIILEGENYHGCTVTEPDAKIVEEVSRNKWAIGQISCCFIQGDRRVRALIVDGEELTLENPNYPITRDLYITTKVSPTREVKRFLEWVLSAEGQSIVKQRFIGLE